MTASSFLDALKAARIYFEEIKEKRTPLICGGMSCTVCPLNIAELRDRPVCFQDLASKQLEKIETIHTLSIGILSSCDISIKDNQEDGEE